MHLYKHCVSPTKCTYNTEFQIIGKNPPQPFELLEKEWRTINS